ncbi:MAG: RNA polymerase sigma factor [Nitriliruptoraceae bacterium]|nr:RNA polymerase sigma factor [Nitriliruptoraceae bacterium]
MDDFEERFPEHLARAREGDALAWTALYREVAPIVTGYLRAQRLPDPDDVAGEVMVELVRGIDRFEGDAGRFRSWSLVIAHHRLIDARRQDARRPATPMDPVELPAAPARDEVESATLTAAGLAALEPALAVLTDEQRTVLLLRTLGDLSIADVAEAIGKRPGAVKQLQRRATTAMRHALEQESAAGPAPGTSRAGRAARDPGDLVDADDVRWTP